ncbi:PSD1 and planctomycete cytochrome C domain-containing protein [Humisphaera borealis]|uniref:PSD1 domain-containing protein n=1 Tax=Humisphaera borealis TaxID=2807512 RepID=A0A7M2WVV8_9BACT|nr:PSD1 and planctomycete cytochrome C domain-containing protein [Humisphaera borealis]QOV89464.1 PSD1 domain-containing protein [Humisphaera borealis]
MSSATRAADIDPAFDKSVQPVLAAHCVECHGGAKKKSGLDLTSRAKVLEGASSGPVVVAGAASQSLLVQLLDAKSDPHMPPKKQLAADDIATIAQWINGLKATAPPAAPTTLPSQNHWSFQPMKRVDPPATKDKAWARNSIDAFVLAELEARGLKPSPTADRVTLIRRATFDLTGLPPTPQEVRAFVADDSADAYEKLIDRLLASPRYGERWARHWLDLARYADSSGFHNDLDRPNAWRYRDYVIASFNADKPYGRFIAEQLAGDEVAPGDAGALAATGFCRNGPSNEDNMGQEAEKHRLDELDDLISTSSAVFLGLTIGCARCHDHKYDPIPQTDYYRLLAVFNSATKKEVSLDAAGRPVLGTRSPSSAGKNAELGLRAPGATTAPATKPATKPAKPDPKAPAIMAMVETSAKTRKTNLLWRGDWKNIGPEVQPGVPVALASVAAHFAEPAKDAPSTGRRAELARWLASPDHPLTWRVMANRLWQHHFGRGIVPTTSNFGLSGERPTHPLLLDWLATELVARGGQLKPMHRLIMTSATYQQSSQFSEGAFAADPENRLLWRMGKRRLEAEAVRDAVLAVSGNLNDTMGGPGIKPRIPPELLVASQRNKWPTVTKESSEHWRRSVYVYAKRQLRLPILELFDAPENSQMCSERGVSTVPTQALVLMNDEFVNEQARYFAVRVQRAVPNDIPGQIALAYELALARPIDAERLKDATAFVAQQTAMHKEAGKRDESAKLALADLCHVLMNSNEFVYVD